MPDGKLELLDAAVRSAIGAGLADVGIVAGEVDPSWDVTTRADGLVVRLYPAGATEQQKASARAAILAADLTNAPALAARAAAKAALDRMTDTNADLLRAVVLTTIDEINSLRDWITSFKAATAAATSLANLQARVAALANLPDRTGVQARQAINNHLDAGDADS